MQHIAGSFCILKSHAHLTIHLMPDKTPLLWTQRGGCWWLFAARPTTNPTFDTGAGGDLWSLCCDWGCPVCSGGGTVGSWATDWGFGAGGNPTANGGLALALLLNKENNEFVLCLGGKHTDVVVLVIVDLNDFGPVLGGCTIYLILNLCCHILPMDDRNQEVIMKRVWNFTSVGLPFSKYSEILAISPPNKIPEKFC